MSIEPVMPSNHFILCCPLLLLPSIFPSIRVFSSESALHIRWPKYWSFSFNIRLSNEHLRLISFRMDWLDLLAVQGTLKSLQYHSSKASLLLCSAFFIVQLSHPYMTTGKNIALTRRTHYPNWGHFEIPYILICGCPTCHQVLSVLFFPYLSLSLLSSILFQYSFLNTRQSNQGTLAWTVKVLPSSLESTNH